MREKWLYLRKSMNISVSHISRVTGISRTTIINFEKGKSTIGIDKLSKMLYELGASMEIIINLNGQERMDVFHQTKNPFPQSLQA